jgi:hypothetical protein
MQFIVPPSAQKISRLFPPLTVEKNFLNPQELSEVCNFFRDQKSRFNYNSDEPEVIHHNCRIHSTQVPESSLSFIRESFQKAFHKLAAAEKLNSAPRLDFGVTLTAKYYEVGDFYRAHVDQSASGLSFLFQLQLDTDQPKPPDLIFLDGDRVTFEHNQLLIFHSYRLHHFDQGDIPVSKGILLMLPGLLP